MSGQSIYSPRLIPTMCNLVLTQRPSLGLKGVIKMKLPHVTVTRAFPLFFPVNLHKPAAHLTSFINLERLRQCERPDTTISRDGFTVLFSWRAACNETTNRAHRFHTFPPPKTRYLTLTARNLAKSMATMELHCHH